MKDYKRLTTPFYMGKYVLNCDYCKEHNLSCYEARCRQMLINKLGELEDKIEQGLLVELPVKVGDTVYFIDEKCWRWEMIVVEIAILKKNIVCKIGNGGKQVLYVYKEDFGKTVFLTKAEAEAKLRELRGEK